MMARDNKETVAVNDVVYIDLGGEDNVAPGNYLTTGIITRSLSEAHTGDWVEIQ